MWVQISFELPGLPITRETKLHTHSFRPPQEIRTMRTYWRQRNDLVRAAGAHIQRMQKVLTQMNIQLANVLSDVSGMTGQAIIKAILAGPTRSAQAG